ncbi:MAG TPA: molecular chaperone DnaJ, partial [Longimicrobiales bacterium]
MRDYYEVLGVAKDADGDAIKRAYRKLALQYHPDRNGGDKAAEDSFREATEAYEVLRDAQKRAAYDRYGHAGVRGGAGAGYGGFNFSDALEIFMRDFGAGGGFEDLFGMRGGGGRSRGGARKGADMRVRLPLTFEEVATGAKKTIRLDRLDACGTCAGTGAAEGSSPVRCSTCGGAGEVQRVQRSFLGQMVTVMPCPECGGDGMKIEKPCPDCSGRGVRPGQSTIEVNVPAGVSTGDYLTLRGQGNAGTRGGPRGDILVVLEVEEDARFTRDGADLIYDLAITFSQAALGTEVDVPLVGAADTKVKISAGTQSGRVLRLRSKGLPHLQGGGRGDMLVRVTVWTPTDLTAEQEQILRKLQQVESAPPAPGGDEAQRGFW